MYSNDVRFVIFFQILFPGQFALVKTKFMLVNIIFTPVDMKFTLVDMKFTLVKVKFTLVNLEKMHSCCRLGLLINFSSPNQLD